MVFINVVELEQKLKLADGDIDISYEAQAIVTEITFTVQ